MGVYKKSVITEAGEALVARAVSGEVVIQFSHAKTSSYTYPEGTNFKKLTELQEVKQTVIPSNVQIANDTLISIRSMFDNSGITQDYLIQNVGIYVSDGETEILFAVCQATTPDQMPAFNGVAPSSFIYNIQISVTQAEQLSISINTAGAATVQDVLDLEKKMEEKKLDSSGGDISNTVVKNFETSAEEFPVPEPGEDLKTLWGKVRKFSGDIKAWMKGVCLLGHIVNNCVTNNPNLPLSAAQGKMLMDLYTVLNTKALKRSEVNDINGQLILTKFAGVQPGAYMDSPLYIKAPYGTSAAARAQMSFENEGSNAAILWLALDGSLRLTSNMGQTYKLLTEISGID